MKASLLKTLQVCKLSAEAQKKENGLLIRWERGVRETKYIKTNKHEANLLEIDER